MQRVLLPQMRYTLAIFFHSSTLIEKTRREFLTFAKFQRWNVNCNSIANLIEDSALNENTKKDNGEIMNKILAFTVLLGLISFDLYANARYSLLKAKKRNVISNVQTFKTNY